MAASGASGVEAGYAAEQIQANSSGESTKKQSTGFKDTLKSVVEDSFSGDSPSQTSLSDAVKKLELLSPLSKTSADQDLLDHVKSHLEKADPQLLKSPADLHTWIAAVFNPASAAQLSESTQKANPSHPFKPVTSPFGPKPISTNISLKMNLDTNSDHTQNKSHDDTDDKIWTPWIKKIKKWLG